MVFSVIIDDKKSLNISFMENSIDSLSFKKDYIAYQMSRPELHGSMTGTREWEYIKYPKPIVSLENFLRLKH